MARGTAAALASSSLLAVSCSLFVSLDDLTEGSADSSSAAASSTGGPVVGGGASGGPGVTVGSGAAAGAGAAGAAGAAGGGGTPATGGGGSGAGGAPPGCSGVHGPQQVYIAALEACIDSTEVTFGQYGEFVLAGVDPSTLPPECGWKTSFAPDSDGPSNHPVADVDWCDAYAYCTWAGKRLCSRVGGGPPLTLAEAKDPGVGEWMTACTAAGTTVYPYGDLYQPMTCNGEGLSNGAVEVATLPACVGGYAGLFDMSGNIVEWENGCATDSPEPQSHLCGARGGDFGESPGNLACQFAELQARSERVPWIGFRCCGD
ncbi:MAG: SUMF1/EgtB/PvdO family nonheme iron enzyme [Polyangiaceae bacterium]